MLLTAKRSLVQNLAGVSRVAFACFCLHVFFYNFFFNFVMCTAISSQSKNEPSCLLAVSLSVYFSNVRSFKKLLTTGKILIVYTIST